MSADKIISAIVNTLEGLSKSFCEKEGELAYLALTSKPEFAVRDRLAFELHMQLSPEYIVAREWSNKTNKRKRIDIAVLRANKHKVLIQLKTWSLFTFTSAKRTTAHFKALYADVKKCQKLHNWRSRVYSLMLATHIESLPDKRYKGVVKYYDGWEKSFEKHKTSTQIKGVGEERIKKEMRNWQCPAHGTIRAGKAFGTRVFLLYWLFRPKKKE